MEPERKKKNDFLPLLEQAQSSALTHVDFRVSSLWTPGTGRVAPGLLRPVGSMRTAPSASPVLGLWGPGMRHTTSSQACREPGIAFSVVWTSFSQTSPWEIISIYLFTSRGQVSLQIHDWSSFIIRECLWCNSTLVKSLGCIMINLASYQSYQISHASISV